MKESIVQLKDVRKTFPGVVALSKMQLDVRKGEILGLIGENGAGKSTLIKVLTGVYHPDEGQIIVEGQERQFKTPQQAISAGISCVYQELNIEKLLSVTDNMFINKWIHKGPLLDYGKMHQIAQDMMKKLGLDVDVRKPAGHYGMGVQQMIEISKALLANAKCIIMDEPTSSLSEKEVEELLKICRDLREQGIGIIFVSHKLEELFQLCDRITVIRDGEYIDTRDVADWDNDSLIKAMVGRSLDNQFPKETGVRSEKPLLEVKNIHRKGVLHNVSFKAYGGEVLGFSGLVGAGRTETMRAIFGADPIDGGEIYIRGEKVDIKNPKDAIRAKIAFLTEDRKGQGLILNESIQNNLILANLKGYKKGLFLNKKDMDTMGEGRINELSIKCPSQEERVGQLSGGNQQKVVIARELDPEPIIDVAAHPTRGLDLGAVVGVHDTLLKERNRGAGVLFISGELQEIMAVSDRIIVLFAGEIMGELDASGVDQNVIGQMMLGKKQEVN